MFRYRIYENVYEAMISGKKHIEIRLLNEKSESIKKGDTIKFDVLDTDKSLMVEVVDKYVFKDVNELEKIMNQKKGNQNEQISFNKEKIMSVIPIELLNSDKRYIEKYIIKAINFYNQNKEDI